MNDYLKRILKELADRVGASYYDLDFSDPEWYKTYSWTEEEAQDFKEWYADQLKDRKVTKALYGDRTTNKALRENRAAWFLLNYGWSKKEEGNDDEKTTTTQ